VIITLQADFCHFWIDHQEKNDWNLLKGGLLDFIRQV
jgi:hypothetical protein